MLPVGPLQQLLILVAMEKVEVDENEQLKQYLENKTTSPFRNGDESEIFSPYHLEVRDIQKRDFRQQYWTEKEDQIYLKFLEDYGHLLRYKSCRRGKQIFSQLSEKMGKKRTAAQCKSHHQKMKKATANGTIKQIMAHVKARHFNNRSFDIKKQQYSPLSMDTEKKEGGKKVGKYLEVKVVVDVGYITIW